MTRGTTGADATGEGGLNSLKPGRLTTAASYLCTQARNSDRGSKPKMPGNLRINHLVVESLVQYARNARTHSEAQMTERNGAGPS